MYVDFANIQTIFLKTKYLFEIMKIFTKKYYS